MRVMSSPVSLLQGLPGDSESANPKCCRSTLLTGFDLRAWKICGKLLTVNPLGITGLQNVTVADVFADRLSPGPLARSPAQLGVIVENHSNPVYVYALVLVTVSSIR